MFYLAAALAAVAAVYCFAAFVANPDPLLPLLVVIWIAAALAALRAAGVPVRAPAPLRRRFAARARRLEVQRTGRRRRLSDR